MPEKGCGRAGKRGGVSGIRCDAVGEGGGLAREGGVAGEGGGGGSRRRKEDLISVNEMRLVE